MSTVAQAKGLSLEQKQLFAQDFSGRKIDTREALDLQSSAWTLICQPYNSESPPAAYQPDYLIRAIGLYENTRKQGCLAGMHVSLHQEGANEVITGGMFDQYGNCLIQN